MKNYSREVLSEDQLRKFGAKLKALMAERGITQEDLMALTGYSRRTVSEWVRGKRTPYQHNTKVLAEFFKVNDRWLRYGEGER